MTGPIDVSFLQGIIPDELEAQLEVTGSEELEEMRVDPLL